MKKLTLFFLFSCLFWSCKQKEIVITPTQNAFEVMPSSFVQNVLMEDFGGEWCTSCVEGAQKIESLRLKYPNRLINVSIHQNDWLEIPYQSYISTLLGGLVSYPRASVNRNVGSNTYKGLDDNFTLLSLENWDNAINNSLKVEAPLAISLETKTDINNKGLLNVYVAYKNPIQDDTRLGIYFIEDNIQSVFQQGANELFIHQHVLKEAKNYAGDNISLLNESEKGQIIKTEINDIDLSKFNTSKLKVVAFIYIHNTNFRKIRVLNSQQVTWGGNKYWDIN